MSARATEYRSTWVLAAVIAVLGLLIWQLLAADMGPPVAQPRPTAAAARDTSVTPASFGMELGPIERYAAMVDRPLFDATRRPPPPAVPEQARNTPAQAPPQFTLQGVVLAPGRRSAIFRNITTSKVMRVTEGSRLGEWTVESLETDRAILRHRDSTHEIVLRHFDTTPPAGGGARPSAQRSRGPSR